MHSEAGSRALEMSQMLLWAAKGYLQVGSYIPGIYIDNRETLDVVIGLLGLVPPELRPMICDIAKFVCFAARS
jgi:hypothetical protein